MNQLYMSSYHLAPDLISHYLRALRQYRIRYLYGYASSLHALAMGARALGVDGLELAVIITNAEPLLEHHRLEIEQVFQCPVRETYGMAEICTAAGECNAGRLHSWPEVGVVEVLAGGSPVRPGQTGDLVCTGLLNADMPLIRYRIGDRGALAPAPRTCDCGRALPVLECVEGRSDDVLYTRDGRMVGRLDPVFKINARIVEAQIVQEQLERLYLRYVPAEGFRTADLDSLVKNLRARLGPVEIVPEAVDRIERTSAGKFRAVVCRLDPEKVQRMRL